MKRALLLSSVLLLIPACGDDASTGDDTGPDADPGACEGLGDPAGSITSYPGSFSGTVAGAGADLTVAEGTCTVDDFYDPVGEDVVVSLGGLTSGQKYAVVLDATDDLGFYVLSGCEVADGMVTGACDVFEDVSLAGEQHTFTASGETAWIVVDTGADAADLTTGDFTLDVFAAECEESPECSGATPQCVDFTCVQCATDFDCDGGTPSCDQVTHECVAGFDQCTGDDAGDTTAPGDDGPTAATAITIPTDGVPTVVAAAVCSLPSTEADWYTFTVTGADVTYGFGLTWASATADLDLYLLDDTGAIVEAGENFDQEPEAFLAELGAGTYFLMARQYGPEATAAASAYTLTFSVPECLTDFECGVGEPICSGAGTCGAGPTACTNDDAGDTATGGDDGPGGGRSLTGTLEVATQLGGNICNVGAGETDFYQVTTTVAGEGLDVSLAWADDTKDLDVLVMDDEGRVLGASFWLRPENVSLTYLPVGTYYLRVNLISETDITDASTVPYTITATRHANLTCVSSTDCAAEHATQVYRGDCTGGACAFITTTGGAAGSACDDADDCTSGLCSYILFEADAERSVCTTECTTTASCSTLAGTTCTTGFSTNICVPACGADLDCGADFNSDTIDTDQPWDYFVCTTPGTGGTCGP